MSKRRVSPAMDTQLLRAELAHLRARYDHGAVSPEIYSVNYRCGFVPDGWFIEHDSWGEIGEYTIFTCVEIEDPSPVEHRQAVEVLPALVRSRFRRIMNFVFSFSTATD